ncbi:hypothetical protein BDN72DRAFT_459204 [Pluteus cervinus]|uniref:Uncharacterized protein n=1 Tax=Pluteus cervinus TaxID=181527 RepID=A0ACD3B0P1_9AGAR|nr:hypothetical protein BDN72DRAFT_459204 [Pluteus cervinus]
MDPPPLADAPFDDQSADTVLRSTTSNVDFLVNRHLLAFSSLFFQTMFSLPQGNVEQEMRDHRPIIRVEEDRETLGMLLGYCYPKWLVGDRLVPSDTIGILKVHHAAQKYLMDGVEHRVRQDLVSKRMLAEEPLRIFAVAVQHGYLEEARIAARETLRLPVGSSEYVPELEDITGGDHYRLLLYHKLCGERAEDVVKDFCWVTNESFVWFECAECRRNPAANAPVRWIISGRRPKWVFSRWFLEYMDWVIKALTERPSGTVATDMELFDATMANASLCRTCFQGGRALKDFREFTSALAREVDRATSEVGIEIRSRA